jgi:lysophospholipase L1-like esterase
MKHQKPARQFACLPPTSFSRAARRQHPVKALTWLTIALVMLAGWLPAHAQLVLSDFSAAHPVKIMYIGDSVTDDCVHVDAWRFYLERLLRTNSFSFVSVGRQLSPTTGGFTNRQYEGYCGAVVAWPGVTETPFVHGYAGTNVYLDKIIPEALASPAGSGTNTPNLFCVYIGINDIGRGRDPYFVATNDLPGLLDILFSNAPNASVILVKTSTIQGTPAHNGLYGSHANNIPIYGAALQAMVNQRRAWGQRVFLADMFSALDYNTQFDSDHEHPNTNGLAAVAREFATRIEAITIRTNRLATTLIYGGSDWKYSDNGQDLGTGWTQLNYDDSGWSHGVARLGYGDATVAAPVSYGPNANNKHITTYFRHPFIVSADAGITNLNFRLARVDGAVVWLNGQEVFRNNLHPAGPVVYSDLALSRVTGDSAYKFFPTNVIVPRLSPGTNLVAVELHQSSVTNAALGFDLELLGSGARFPAPMLSAAVSGNNAVIAWPATNTTGYTLYSTTDLNAGGGWSVSSAPLETNAGQIITTVPAETNTMFFRLQGP